MESPGFAPTNRRERASRRLPSEESRQAGQAPATTDGVIVTWRIPAEFSLSDVTLVVTRDGLVLPGLTGLSTNGNTVPNADGSMTTTLPLNLLGGIALGSQTRTTFQVKKGSWTTGGSVLVTSRVIGGYECSPR